MEAATLPTALAFPHVQKPYKKPDPSPPPNGGRPLCTAPLSKALHGAFCKPTKPAKPANHSNPSLYSNFYSLSNYRELPENCISFSTIDQTLKLTHSLISFICSLNVNQQHSLSGNSLTVLICCVKADVQSITTTSAALQFASKARAIKTKVQPSVFKTPFKVPPVHVNCQ
jgi:hypothetical protein